MKPDYFNENWYQQWFMGGEDLDKTIKEKFGQDVEAIKTGKIDDWRTKSPFECLAGTAHVPDREKHSEVMISKPRPI